MAKINNGISRSILTEEKVRKLKPLFERALNNKYGNDIRIVDLTVGHIKVNFQHVKQKGK